MDSDTPSPPQKIANWSAWLRPRSKRRFALVDQQLRVSLITSAIIVSGALGFWLLGKLSWNHDPLVSQSFAAASIETLTNRPQSAALEFHHALTSGNFTYAKTLVSAEAADVVTGAEQQCGDSCPDPKRTMGKVFTRAALLESSGQSAVVRAESFDDRDSTLGSATYELLREGNRWMVVGIRTN